MITTNNDPTELIKAIQQENVDQKVRIEQIQNLLKTNIDINERTQIIKLTHNKSQGFSRNEILKINSKMENRGFTALMAASEKPHNEEIIRLLLEKGADLNIQDTKGRNALCYAALNANNKNAIELLINAGANLNEALMTMVQIPDNKEALENLLASGANINYVQKIDDKKTSILKAAALIPNNSTNLNYLINQLKQKLDQASIFEKAEKEKNFKASLNHALFAAVKIPNNVENIKILLSAGADPNVLMDNDQTALTEATNTSNNFENIQYLLTQDLKKINFDENKDLKRRILYHAAPHPNNEKTLEFILANIALEDPSIDFEGVLSHAAEIPENSKNLRLIISKKASSAHPISPKIIENVLLKAILVKENTDNIACLLKDPSNENSNIVDEKLLNKLLQAAVRVKSRDFVKKNEIIYFNQDNIKLLSNFPNANLEEALFSAVHLIENQGNLDALLDLKPLNAELLTKLLIESVQERGSPNKGNTANIDFIIVSHKELLTKEMLAKVLIEAVKVTQNLPNIKLLLDKLDLDAETLHRILLEAVKIPDNGETIKFLIDRIENVKNNKIHLPLLLQSAAQSPNNEENLNLLFTLLKPGDYEEALKIATQQNDLKFQKYLEDHWPKAKDPELITWKKNPFQKIWKGTKFLVGNLFAIAFTIPFLVLTPIINLIIIGRNKIKKTETPTLPWPLLPFGILGKAVLPAQVIYSKKSVQEETEFAREFSIKTFKEKKIKEGKQMNLKIDRLKVITHDGAELDTTEIQQKDKDPKDQKYIIHVLGNAQCHSRQMTELQNDADRLGCNVIGFDYRGVDKSVGSVTSRDDLVTDLIAQIQRLLDLDVKPENITLKGHSLGAAVATLVAKHFHDKEGIDLYLFNGRSFSTMSNAASGLLGGGIASTLVYPIVKPILVLADFEMDPATAFKELPKDHKEYIVVNASESHMQQIKEQFSQEKNRENLTKIALDEVIAHGASLHSALKKEAEDEVKEIDEFLKKEGLNLTSAQREIIDDRRKMVCSVVENEKNKTSIQGGHNVTLDQIKDRHNISATDFFDQFFLNQGKPRSLEQLHPTVADIRKKVMDDRAKLYSSDPLLKISNQLEDSSLKTQDKVNYETPLQEFIPLAKDLKYSDKTANAEKTVNTDKALDKNEKKQTAEQDEPDPDRPSV